MIQVIYQNNEMKVYVFKWQLQWFRAFKQLVHENGTISMLSFTIRYLCWYILQRFLVIHKNDLKVYRKCAAHWQIKRNCMQEIANKYLKLPLTAAETNKPAIPGTSRKTLATNKGIIWSGLSIIPAWIGSHPSKYAYIAKPVSMDSEKKVNVGMYDTTAALKNNIKPVELLFVGEKEETRENLNFYTFLVW